MAEGLHLSLVVPLFDEVDRLPDAADALVEFVAGAAGGGEVLLVDDGSADATAEVADALAAAHPDGLVRVIRRPHLGKGATVAAGLRAARGRVLAFCDVDLATPLREVARIVDAAERADVLAVGSRDLTASRLVQPEGAVRELLGRSYNRLLQATVTPGVLDTQCGAKAARRDVWEAVLPHSRERGFAWDAEVIAVALALGISVQEVAIDWAHDGRSKVNVGRDGLRMVLSTPAIRRRAAAARRAAASTPAVDSAEVDEARPSQSAEVFDEANAAALLDADASHWWFRSKAALVTTAIRRTVPADRRSGRLVDVGAGAGGVTAALGWRPERVVVVEGNERLAAHARRGRGLAAVRGEVGAPPLHDGCAEVVCLLDVVEHLDDPVAALVEARRLLAPGGSLVLTVPAHHWLWSEADDALGHRRRHTRATVRAELRAAGFEPELLTHVFGWLVAPVWAARRGPGRSGEAHLGLDRAGTFVTVAAMVLTWCERLLVGRVPVPLGTSVLCVARVAEDRP